jgi:hypothetical protein
MMSHIIKTTAYVRLLRSALTALLMLAAIAGTAVAGPLEFVQDLSGSTQFEKGRAAYGSGDYETALRLWRPLAADGDAMAQFYMGTRGIAAATSWLGGRRRRLFSLYSKVEHEISQDRPNCGEFAFRSNR